MTNNVVLEQIVTKIQEDVNAASGRKEGALTEIVQRYERPATYRTTIVNRDVYNKFYDRCVHLERERNPDPIDEELAKSGLKIILYMPPILGASISAIFGLMGYNLTVAIFNGLFLTALYYTTIGTMHGISKMAQTYRNIKFQQKIKEETENTLRLLTVNSSSSPINSPRPILGFDDKKEDS